MDFHTDFEELLAHPEITEKKDQVEHFVVWFACDWVLLRFI